jgi:hypothetical protein
MKKYERIAKERRELICSSFPLTDMVEVVEENQAPNLKLEHNPKIGLLDTRAGAHLYSFFVRCLLKASVDDYAGA